MCVNCLQVFCGSFEGFIFGASLLPVVQGDVNADGATNTTDLLLLLGSWGTCPADDACAADLDLDGAVNVSDLLVLLGGWS